MTEIAKILNEYKKAKEVLRTIEQKTNLMVERKMQQTSGGTFFICLPKEWAKKLEITKGQKVMLVWSKDNTLTIVT